MTQAVLTFNAGSSSLKCALFENTGGHLVLAARAEIEDLPHAPHFMAKDANGGVLEEKWAKADQDYSSLIAEILSWAEAHLGKDSLIAAGHRVVHGGPDHHKPEPVTEDLLKTLEGLIPLAPLHQPHNLAPMRALAKARPGLLQVACFDTGFHRTVPAVAARFALPRRYEEQGIRRYGFHGLSYEYIALKVREIAPELARGRIIAAHLGNGASLCAMKDGKSLDTTMGFTALDGLVMGTRPGALDPGVLLYLEREDGLSTEALEKMLYNESGLLGVSGLSSDMRTLLASGEKAARDAIELFVYRLVREVGALAAALGGLDGLIFTAGIGENAPRIREMACAGLHFLGAKLDDAANRKNQALISAPESRIAIRVIPTNEEEMIARHTLALFRAP